MVIRIIKYIVSILAIIILLLFGVLFSVVKLYDKEIKEIALKQINNQLISPMIIQDIELSAFNYFPAISLQFSNVLIKDPFANNDTLLFAKSAFLNFDAYDLINEKYIVRKLVLKNGSFAGKISANGEENFNVFATNDKDENKNFKFSLDQLTLNNFSINYQNIPLSQEYDFTIEYFGKNFQFTLGGGANQYLGGHYGEVIWSQYASNGNIRHRYYDNDATKNDINVYGKLNYDLSSDLSAYVDLQQRIVTYDFTGLDQDGGELDQTSEMSFFNPKVGFNYSLNEKTSLYAFAGVGNKEPSRDDFTESTPNDRPSHESLLDIEIGYRYFSKKISFSANFYNMQYNNQLILTGELNDVGSAVRVNIPNSYRRGIELTGSFQLMDKLLWRLNATFSENKIAEFKEFIDNWDTGVKDSVTHTNTNIAFSPSIIGGSQLIFTAFNSVENGKLDLALVSKYVGDQFIDNTSSEYAKLEAYIVNDFRVSYTVKTKLFKEVVISSWIRNLSNKNYISNAWVYRFNTSSDPTTYDPYANAEGSGTNSYNQIGAFNQAGINFFVGLNLKF